jgi:hypothetical protein
MNSKVGKKLRMISLLSILPVLFILNPQAASAHDHGANKIHEVQSGKIPTISLDVKKDPTGGFNVKVITTNFVWTPESASEKHIEGQGHAHVYLADQKIIRLYNNWFHLNTFQFATTSGEQLLRVELVGNDHAPITVNAQQISSELLVDVPSDEIRPQGSNAWKLGAIGAASIAFALGAILFFSYVKRNGSKA